MSNPTRLIILKRDISIVYESGRNFRNYRKVEERIHCTLIMSNQFTK